jgi:hypothetical protein
MVQLWWAADMNSALRGIGKSGHSGGFGLFRLRPVLDN